jgi:hypothetical protein
MSKIGCRGGVARLVVGLLVVLGGALPGCGRSEPVPAPAPGEVKGIVKPKGKKPDIRELAVGEVLEVPYILWGGDVATFLANGGEATKPGSIFHDLGLNLKLTRGDNFDEQVKRYKEGVSPFLRGTMSMLGQVSEDVGNDVRSQPVVFLQLTWSAGDHLVSRPSCKTLNDLKGRKIALQKGGPHVGMLQDILHTAQLGWPDITVVWTDDVTGDNGPAALFRKDDSIDACFAITPDMMGLTGGLDQTGSGANDTVKDAHVLVSTSSMLRSIADVYACRKDYFDEHRDVVEKLTAGYLKATEELVAMRKESKDKPTPRFQAILDLTQKMFGKDVPSAKEAEGLIADAVFVGLPGNYSFFKDTGNLSGFNAKMLAALDLAVSLGNAQEKVELLQADLDYGRVRSLGKLTSTVDPAQAPRFADNPKEKNTLYSFNVYFGGDESTFPEATYHQDFQRAVEQASLFGNAIISVRGHANAQELMWFFKDYVVKNGILAERQGKYFRRDGSDFNLNDMKQIVDLIHQEKLGGVKVPVNRAELSTVQKYLDYLLDLSNRRAAAVRAAVVGYAKAHGYRLDESQIKSVGVGGLEPVIMFPRNDAEGGRNRRVEFRLIQVGMEAITSGDIDY